MSEKNPTPEEGSTARRSAGGDEVHATLQAGSATLEDNQAPASSETTTTSPETTASPGARAEVGNAIVEVEVQPGFSRATGVAIALGATALAIGLLSTFADIIAPVFLGVNLLIAAYPVYTVLVRVKVPRALAAIATGLTVLLVLAAGVAAIVWSGTSMVTALRGYSDQFTELYTHAIQLLGRVGFDESALLDQLKSVSPSNVLGVVKGLVSNASGATGIILVVLVAMVFMVMDLPSMKERMGITDRLHPAFSSNIETFISGIRRYWLVTTIFGIIVAALDGGVLLLLGVPLPLVWAVLSFITNYIPNVGFIIGLLPPALLALVEKGPVTALIVVLAYSVMNFVIQSIIQPKFTGDAVGITPTVSFISLLLWTAVFGPLGALIALPFTLMIKAMLLDSDPRTRWINALIAANPKTVEEPT
ncbi:AI-2E family transporter [Tessaracoccus antarcticus]|uniref:AI-2E family transporter n=1 Tax=Tessaracoccus antarcticus TaxID=2479848 RepID=A0A3M0FZ78_9ACTN|nr:AI-2E family transporter [Tessaracoccus antarcticus]RMB57805.1 AI-2E family transporter [Tessaracoccus antarcticus]